MSEPLRTAPNIPECSCDRNDDSWVGEPGPMPLCSYHERWLQLSWESLMCMVIDFEAALAASPSSDTRPGLREDWLAAEIARAFNLLHLEGYRSNESYGRAIADYLMKSLAALPAESSEP